MDTLKKLFGPLDMTQGEPWKKIMQFMVPMLLGNIAQQLYNTVDSIVVGRYVGDNALAAVGSAGPILQLVIVLFVGISIGASVMVSQYLGAKKREELSVTVCNCIVVTGAASLFIMVFATLITRPLLVLMATPESILDWCEDYLIILFLGSAGLAYYNILSGVLRGLGDSVSALLYLLVSTFLNIVLDIYFVSSLGMGVGGVALATILAQGISGVLCLRRLMSMKALFDMKKEYFRPRKECIRDLVRLGLPSGLSQAILSLSLLIVQSLANSFGESVIAANVIVQRLNGFATLPNMSFGTALTTFTGQNIGAERMERVEKGARQGTLMALVSSVLLTAALLLFGPSLIRIFTETDLIVETAQRMLVILGVGYVAMGVIQTLSGVMQGAGDAMTPMWISLAMIVGIRVPLAYGIAWFTRSSDYPTGRPECLFLSLTIAWVLGAVVTSFICRRGKWKGKAVVGK